MARGPSYHGRRTPLPRERKRARLHVTPMWALREDQRAAVESVLTLKPVLHPACRSAISDDKPRSACVRCRFYDGIEDDETAYYEFWAMEGGY